MFRQALSGYTELEAKGGGGRTIDSITTMNNL